ncbi:carbohydrate ABC transporter permease [Demequina sp.]|uniref:carbohydrate ABC transporter permease n=1 Tax=Demequina sp. TaxID=2050685 RepID=UPI0025BDB46C|nr:carbohydrate ABC transporter permease [Demequina sp.]
MTNAQSQRARSRRWRAARSYLVLTVLAAAYVAPAYYLVIGSFKPAADVLSGLGGFAPQHLNLDNYRSVFDSLASDSTGYFWQFMTNSILISLAVVVVGLVVNSMAAYSFARLSWRGRDKSFLLVVALVIVPFEAVAIPLLFMLNDMRNSLLVQALPFFANAFSVYLFYTFFLGLSKDIEEAARLDGLGSFGTFVRIAVPSAKPVFATVAILTFMTTWGQYLWPSLVVSNPRYRPLPLELSVFSGQMPVDWGEVLAFGTLLILPVLIFFVAFQRFFVQSLASSAVKG